MQAPCPWLLCCSWRSRKTVAAPRCVQCPECTKLRPPKLLSRTVFPRPATTVCLSKSSGAARYRRASSTFTWDPRVISLDDKELSDLPIRSQFARSNRQLWSNAGQERSRLCGGAFGRGTGAISKPRRILDSSVWLEVPCCAPTSFELFVIPTRKRATAPVIIAEAARILVFAIENLLVVLIHQYMRVSSVRMHHILMPTLCKRPVRRTSSCAGW